MKTPRPHFFLALMISITVPMTAFGHGGGFPSPVPPFTPPYNPPPYTPPPVTGNSAIQRLAYEAQQLQSQIQYTRLGFDVQDAVRLFATQAQNTAYCERSGSGMPGRPGYPGYPGYPYPPSPRDCSYELNETAQRFYQVERYLYDTYYEYPAVYQQYVRTKQTLDEALRGGTYPGPTPPPPPRQLRSVGLFDVTNFYFVGARRPEIRSQCLNFGYSRGISAVRLIIVNNQRYDAGAGYYSIEQACQLVTQLAQ